MDRIIMHWTAGSYTPTEHDLECYHFVVAGDGEVHPGKFKPEANLNIKNGFYAAHTRACNTGSVGVSMAAMMGAIERPFQSGLCPIKTTQLNAFIDLVADLSDLYKIKVTRRTVLCHSEVEPTLGIWQKQKWDINWLPGMKQPGDAVEVGDRLRAMVTKKLESIPKKVGWFR